MPLIQNSQDCIVNDDNVLTNRVIETDVPETAIGLLWGFEVQQGVFGLFFISKGTVNAVTSAPYFSSVKDTANKLNIYFEGGIMKIQNKLPTTKYLYVRFERLI